jgi:hypothetical protein
MNPNILRTGIFTALLLFLCLPQRALSDDTGTPKGCNAKLYFGAKDDQAFLAFDKIFRTALKNQDAGLLASVVEFPLALNYSPDDSISLDTPTALQSHFQEAFPPSIRDAVLKEDPTQVSCSYDGIMYGNGDVWAEPLGGPEPSETRYRVVAVNLHAKKTETPVSHKGRVDYICDTKGHHIVIDEPSGDAPRYRSWNNPHTVLDAPDMLINAGIHTIEGSGVCAGDMWKFKKGDTEFDVYPLGCTDGSEPSNARGALEILIKGELKQTDWCT